MNEKMRKLGTERSAIRELYEYGLKRKAEVGEESVFDFSLGNPSVPTPESVQREIVCLLESVSPEVLHGYTSASGDTVAREKIALSLAKRTGMAIKREHIFMTTGAAASLVIVLSALCNEGDEVIVVSPFFPEYAVFAQEAGAKLVVVPSDENFHLDISAMKEAITPKTRAVILNSPNNPTGVIYSEAELRALSEVLNGYENIVLVSDEPYRKLTYGTPVPEVMPIFKNAVVIDSFSKSLSLAGERIGYVALSPKIENWEELFAAIAGSARSKGYVCAPALFQRVASACVDECTDVDIYRTNRDILYSALTEYGYKCVSPDGAFYLFVKSPVPDEMAFSELAKEEGLLLVPSSSFGVKGYVRISYCVEKKTVLASLPTFKRLAEKTL